MAESLSIKQKKEWAQQLYCENQLSQKAIADKVDVSEKTLSKWVNDGNWDTLRKNLLVSRQEQLSRLLEQLDELTAKIREKPTGSRYASTAEADTIKKLTASIKDLMEETNLSDVFEVGKKFIQFMQQVDFEKSKEAASWYDAFIKNELKEL